MLPGRSYLMRIGTKYVPARVTSLKHKVDVNTPGAHRRQDARAERDRPVQSCDRRAGGVRSVHGEPRDRRLHSHRPLHQRHGRRRHDHLRPAPRHQHPPPERCSVDKAARVRLNGHRPAILWFTGLSGSGKSTIANIVERELHAAGAHTYMLDGDNVRHGLNRDLGFTDADRVENIRRVGEVAELFVDAGADRAVLVHLAVPRRAADGARAGRRGRVRRDLRRHAARGVHAARSEGAVRARARRARSRTSPASTRPTRRRRIRRSWSIPARARRRTPPAASSPHCGSGRSSPDRVVGARCPGAAQTSRTILPI